MTNTVFTRIRATALLLIFRATSAALIGGRRLFEHCTRQIYFFYIFIQRYTFYLIIFLWTDTKLIVNLELREKFTRGKKPRQFHYNKSENISDESIGGVALNNFFVPDMALIRGRLLIEGGAYSSKYGYFYKKVYISFLS